MIRRPGSFSADSNANAALRTPDTPTAVRTPTRDRSTNGEKSRQQRFTSDNAPQGPPPSPRSTGGFVALPLMAAAAAEPQPYRATMGRVQV